MADCLDSWTEFPKLGLVVNGQKKFYPRREAVVLLDSEYHRVEPTGEVLMADFTVRRQTTGEARAFQERADQLSASR